LKSNNLSLDEAMHVAQNHPLWRLMSTFAATHSCNAGKPGNLGEFVNSGKFRENACDLKFTQRNDVTTNGDCVTV